MSAWARPGVKCVCIGNWTDGWRSDEGQIELPMTRQVYTVREVHPDGDAIRLVEIVNPPLRYAGDNVTEVWFMTCRFRPLVSKTQEQDIALFTPLLDSQPKHRKVHSSGVPVMTESKYLGHIKSANLGHDGDGRFGLSIEFACDGYGSQTFVGGWATRPEHAAWTIEDQMASYAQAMVLVRDTLTSAKRRTVDQLRGIPVEVTFDNGMLKAWRVLTEVIP